jgi:hypothetical protein
MTTIPADLCQPPDAVTAGINPTSERGGEMMIDVKRYRSARELLESVQEAKLEIARHRARAMELESRCTKMTASMSGMPRGGGSDAQLLWSTLADYRDKEFEAEQRELEAYRSVEEFISMLPSRKHRTVLRLKYLDCLSWVKVQMKMYDIGDFYSERHIYRIHDKALESAEEVWKNLRGELNPHRKGGDTDEVPT